MRPTHGSRQSLLSQIAVTDTTDNRPGRELREGERCPRSGAGWQGRETVGQRAAELRLAISMRRSVPRQQSDATTYRSGVSRRREREQPARGLGDSSVASIPWISGLCCALRRTARSPGGWAGRVSAGSDEGHNSGVADRHLRLVRAESAGPSWSGDRKLKIGEPLDADRDRAERLWRAGSHLPGNRRV